MVQNFVSRLESSANTNPEYSTLRRLAVALGMTTDQFIREMEATE
jgi:transcriptional regulator with XRE-family HTH domain